MSSSKVPRPRTGVKLNLIGGDAPGPIATKEEDDMNILKLEPAQQKGGGLDSGLQSQIGHKLKAMFDEVAQAPIPDKFLELLQRLDGKEQGK